MAYTAQRYEPLGLSQVSPLAYALQQGIEGVGKGVDLRKKLIENQIENYKKQYTPLTLQADAMSKLAYSNLMGPQFIAKLLNNPELLANIPDEQKQQLLKFTTNAGTNSPLNNPAIQNAIQQSSSGNNQAIQNPVQQNRPSDNYLFSQRDQENINNLQPGNSYTPQDQFTEKNNQPKKTFAENVGEYEGIKKEGEEGGKIRADDIQDLGHQYEAGLKLSDKFNSFNNLINNPTFQSMRSGIPGFQGMQLKVLKNFGTPEQQELIGEFTNTANEIVKDTISSFPGQKLRGEVSISQNMKVNDNDTFNVMVGKVRSAEIYKELSMQRAKMTADIMEKYHVSKRKAEDMANKNLNAQGVIDDINKTLDYTVQIRNKKTGQIENVPVSVARQRGVPGV